MYQIKLVNHNKKLVEFMSFSENFKICQSGSTAFANAMEEANRKPELHHAVIICDVGTIHVNNAETVTVFADGSPIHIQEPVDLDEDLTHEACAEVKPKQEDRAQGSPETFAKPYGVDEREFKIPTGLMNARSILGTAKGLKSQLDRIMLKQSTPDQVDVKILSTHLEVVATAAFYLIRLVESISPFNGVTSEKLLSKADELLDNLNALDEYVKETRASGATAFYNELFAGLANHPSKVIPDLITLAERMVTTNRAHKPT